MSSHEETCETFIGQLLCTRNYARYFVDIFSFNPHTDSWDRCHFYFTVERAETLWDLVTCPRQSWNLDVSGSDSKTHHFTRKLTSLTQGNVLWIWCLMGHLSQKDLSKIALNVSTWVKMNLGELCYLYTYYTCQESMNSLRTETKSPLFEIPSIFNELKCLQRNEWETQNKRLSTYTIFTMISLVRPGIGP